MNAVLALLTVHRTLWPSAGRVIASISTNKDETTNAGLFQTYYRGAALVGGLVLAGSPQHIQLGQRQLTLSPMYVVTRR